MFRRDVILCSMSLVGELASCVTFWRCDIVSRWWEGCIVALTEFVLFVPEQKPLYIP